MKKEKETYLTPEIEVVEFTMEEGILLSTNLGSDLLCSEEIHG